MNKVDEDQQRQTLNYFRTFAAEWRQKAEGMFPALVNVIEQRNSFVLMVVSERATTRRALDVGCGTGELCCELSRHGIEVVGIDFAQEMIDLCNRKKADEGAETATFVCSSIFDYKPNGVSFDIISANGFIEYISSDEMDRLLEFVREHLLPGGSLVLGSRNRLFNAFSLNDYTRMEQGMGVYDSLVEEALDICASDSMAACIANLEKRRAELPVVERHPATGIGVATRHQFTPAELIGRLARFGLRTAELYPVHYHGVVPRFAKDQPEVHVAVSNLIQKYCRRQPALLPFASSYMIHGVI